MTNNEMVKQFMEAFGQEVKNLPALPDHKTQALRLELIIEEVEELFDAHDEQDMVKLADALTDILYVVYGFGHALGIDLDRCFRHVHYSNMSKLGRDGKPIYREDGKVMKGPNYWAPKLEEIIFNKKGA